MCINSMIKINYITNLSVQDSSGGWSGVNYHLYKQLFKKFEINLIEKVNPPYHKGEKIISKFLRVLGLRGAFPAFTNSRLNKIKGFTENQIHQDAVFNFYHGVTPWIGVQSKLPYVLYTDASFATYIRIYHDENKFAKWQLHSIFIKEKDFLCKANLVFFTSQWALDDTKKCYGISGHNFHVASMGGGYEKKSDVKVQINNPYFLFVGFDFAGKGGDMVCIAFDQLSKKYPDFRMKLVGQRPPEKYLHNKSITYCGFFNKAIPTECKALRDLFSYAYCFILPTVKDITPLVLVDAGSVGCPAISVNNFGIPEIVIHEKTGLLINKNELTVDNLLAAMELMCSNQNLRNKFGENAEKYIKDNFSWEKTGEIIYNKMMKIFENNF